MTRRLLVLGVALAIIPAAALAQTPTPTPNAGAFVDIKVGAITYHYDAFFPCGDFLIARTERLGEPITLEWQGFYVDEHGKVVAEEPRPGLETALTADSLVGDVFYCQPQLGEDELDG